ncbi:MAG: MgtC/SapB family protein [bacterium]|nr:MgtC/SapB family protein [bacterium]
MFDQIEILFAWRLAAAVLLGALVGLERSIAGKHAGMRTYALVSLGSCLFVVVGTLASYQLSVFVGINPLQIASSVVIGIGFIGSGLAIMRGNSQMELTTASGVWVVAGVGMACGFGLYLLAAVTSILSILVFAVFSRGERLIRVRWGNRDQ